MWKQMSEPKMCMTNWKMATVLTTILGCACTVSAQTIHDHPQLAAYASSDQWPTSSAQCHWTPSDALAMIAHTHVDVKFPLYAENTGVPFTVPFTLKLFHTSGQISQLFGELIRDVVWDETGTSTQPLMVGDPMGLKQWTGRLTIDPSLGDIIFHPVPHGWFDVRVAARTEFTNGDRTDT